ncbi:MAG: Zn-dependent exopeptidase M28 [Bdellovibrionales bacterium]|nr:Zn-dependent exopeptidase M28 [Bdellovibrionales bacterium]
MNRRLRLFAVLGALLLLTGTALRLSAFGGNDPEPLYLVVSHHPHDLDALAAVTLPYLDEGRLKVVRLRKEFGELTPALQSLLRRVRPSELKSYRPEISTRSLKRRADVEEVLKKISKTTYQDYLTFMASFEDRDAAGLDRKENSGNERAVKWLQEEFEKLSYQTSLHCYKARRYAEECNVVAMRPGRELPNEWVVVVGHLDDVGHHQAGADDNASGAVALLEMARVLNEQPTARTLVFLAANGEETGLVGSKAYVKSLSESGDLAKVKYSINMDMIGYNEDGVIDIETNNEFEPEAQWYSTQVKTYTRLTPNITMPAWGSDHVPFLNQKIPTILTIEHWDTKTPCYHQSCDKLNTVAWDYAMEIVKLNVAVSLLKAGLI